MKLITAIKMGLTTLSANMVGGGKPLNVMLAVTNKCDQRCRYCQIPERSQPEMNTKQIISLLSEMKAAGTKRLGLWGGEPMVRPDIGDIVEEAKRLGFWVSMDTNGGLVPQKLDVVRMLDHLIVSIDGPKEVNDLNRQDGSYESAIDALEAARGLTSIWTLSVLTRNNLDAIEFLLENAKRFSALAAFQFLHHNETMAGNTDTMRPENKAYRRAVARLIELKRCGEPVASSYRYLKHLLHWPNYKAIKSRRPRGQMRCWAGRLYCNVDVDGTVAPCSLLIGERPARNALEVGFEEAFRFSGQHVDCRSCDAACFTEYNFIYDLDPGVIWDWLLAMRKTGGRHG